MNPFKKMTRQERSEVWNNCDPLLTHMLGSTEEDFLNAAPCETASPEIVRPWSSELRCPTCNPRY